MCFLSACVFPDKLTGVLPILSPGGVPLPKVAAHVTGVTSSAEPPTADGEDPLMWHRSEINYPVYTSSRASYVCNEVLESLNDILNTGHSVASPIPVQGQR